MKIVVLEAAALGKDVSWQPLEQYGDLTIYDYTKQEEISERIKDADIIVGNKLLYNEKVLSNAKNLKLICEAATGYNNVDIEYCKEHNILVTNCVGYSTPIVAQHTFALLLYVYESLSYYDNYVKDGSYGKCGTFTHISKPIGELWNKRWGIIGFGNIGREVANIAAAFGCEVVYFSASDMTYDVPFSKVKLDELLRTCDIVSIHCPLNDDTRNLINYERLKLMKKNAVIINVARGPIVNEADLARALNENIIGGAGIDVYSKEPLEANNPLNEIKDGTKLIMTPHIAWGSFEARTRLVSDMGKSIAAFIDGKPRSLVS